MSLQQIDYNMSIYSQAEVEKVFVYGTLKRSEDRGSILGDTYLNEDKVRGFMVTWGAPFPAVVLEERAPLVHGQVFACDKEMLKRLDEIEGTPHLYTRVAIKTFMGNIAWIYIMPFDRIKASEHRVIINGEWSKKQGTMTMAAYMNDHIEYSYPKRPHAQYMDKHRCMVVIQKEFYPLPYPAQPGMARGPDYTTVPIVVPPPPPQEDTDPVDGEPVVWASPKGSKVEKSDEAIDTQGI